MKVSAITNAISQELKKEISRLERQLQQATFGTSRLIFLFCFYFIFFFISTVILEKIAIVGHGVM